MVPDTLAYTLLSENYIIVTDHLEAIANLKEGILSD